MIFINWILTLYRKGVYHEYYYNYNNFNYTTTTSMCVINMATATTTTNYGLQWTPSWDFLCNIKLYYCKFNVHSNVFFGQNSLPLSPFSSFFLHLYYSIYESIYLQILKILIQKTNLLDIFLYKFTVLTNM